MAKQENIKTEGIITNDLSNGIFEVSLIDKDGEFTGHSVRGTISGKLRTHNIRLNVQDKVTIEISPYDLSLGRIVFRHNIPGFQGVSTQNPKNKRKR